MTSPTQSFSRERTLSLPVYKLYRRRFYVLFVFAFLAFNQCLFWLTFGPISNRTQEYYQIDETQVDILLALGPFCFILCLPLTYILLNMPNGLKYCVRLLAIICLVATIIRAIPSIVVSSSNPNFKHISLPFLYIGQILNAVCGPLAMAPVSQLSSLWFDTNERTRATTAAIMSYNLGSTTGFLMAPAIVYSAKNLPYLLYSHVGLALIACVLALIYFPAQPPTPPSPAAELLIRSPIGEDGNRSCHYYLRILQQCIKTPSFVLLVAAGGLIGGTFAAWTALFDTILTHENYTDIQSGWFGFGASIGEIFGGFCSAFVADMPRFHRSFKILILISFIMYFLAVAWYNLSIHTLIFNRPVLPSSVATMASSVTLAGLFQGSAQPLTYEALAEIMYPLPESLSASILVELINMVSLILFFIAPRRPQLMNLIILIIIATCIILVLLTRFMYKRRDADRTKRNTLVPMDTDSLYDATQMDAIDNLSQTTSITDTTTQNPILDLHDI